MKQATVSRKWAACAERGQGSGLRRVRIASTAFAALLGLAGCRQDMHNQPKFYYQRGTSFYADGRSARPQVQNTVARNQADSGSYLRTGFVNGKEGDGMPFPVTQDLLERGQQSYNVFCQPCHSRVGNGAGIIVQRGYRPAGNFHTDRLRAMPLGHFFNVISNGWGAMPDYAGQVSVEERWAIVAYVRALQLSQNAETADAGGAHVERLEDVAEREGLPRDFAREWVLPATAVSGKTPEAHGIPGQDEAGSQSQNNGSQGSQPDSRTTSPIGPATDSSERPVGIALPSHDPSSERPASLNGPQ